MTNKAPEPSVAAFLRVTLEYNPVLSEQRRIVGIEVVVDQDCSDDIFITQAELLPQIAPSSALLQGDVITPATSILFLGANVKRRVKSDLCLAAVGLEIPPKS